MPPHDTPHAPVTVDLRWQADRPLDRSLFPEVLVLDAQGRAVANSLEAPQGGFYPTWRWLAGEIVADRRRIVLPQDLPSGDYRVVLRVHDFGANRTLAVDGNQDQDGGGVVG